MVLSTTGEMGTILGGKMQESQLLMIGFSGVRPKCHCIGLGNEALLMSKMWLLDDHVLMKVKEDSQKLRIRQCSRHSTPRASMGLLPAMLPRKTNEWLLICQRFDPADRCMTEEWKLHLGFDMQMSAVSH